MNRKTFCQLILCLSLFLPVNAWAQWSNTNLGNGWTGVVSTLATPGANGGSTTGVTTTTANLLLLSVSDRIDTTNSCTPTDTINGSASGNTWTALVTNTNDRGVGHARFWYVNSQTPNVGVNHVVTCTGTAIQPTLIFHAINIVGGWSLDQQNGAAAGGTVASIQTGSITPGANSALIITNVSDFGGVVSAYPTGFTGIQGADALSGTNAGGFTAFATQATPSAVNPTWAFNVSPSFSVAEIVSFIPGSAPSGTAHNLLTLGVGR